MMIVSEPNGLSVLARLEQTRAWLESATSIDEVSAIRDQAEALRYAARAANAGLEIQNACTVIKLRAERRAGELLQQTPKQRPGEYQRSHDVTVAPTLAELGIGRMESSRWQRVASIPDDLFEAHLSTVQARGEELSTAGVLELAKQIEREHAVEQARQEQAHSDDLFAAGIAVIPGAAARLERAALRAQFKRARAAAATMHVFDPAAITASLDAGEHAHELSFIASCRRWLDAYEAELQRGLRPIKLE